MNDMRKLIETIEQINEVSDFDGPVDKLIKQFEETCKEIGIENNPVKKKELLQVVQNRGFEGPGGLGHENVLGNDHKPSYQQFPG